jgi:hypothetical protein
MQTKQRSNSAISHRITGSVIAFAVANVGELQFDTAKASDANNNRARFHGWIQRIHDAAAIERTDDQGRVIPAAELVKMKYHAMNDLITFYEGGGEEWNRRGTRGEQQDASLTIRAVAAVKGMTEEAVRASVKRKAEALNVTAAKVLAILRQDKAVKAKMEEMLPPTDAQQAEEMLAAL